MTRVNPDHFVLDKGGASVLGHLFHVKSNVLRTIDSREQPWSHTGVVVVRGRADQSDFVAALNILGEIQENSEVRVSASDQNKMPSHKSPVQNYCFLPSHSWEGKRSFSVLKIRFFRV